MKRILLYLFFLVMASTAIATADQEHYKKNKNIKKEEYPADKKTETEKRNRKKNMPIHIFRPSEKIGADTIVDFPVDI